MPSTRAGRCYPGRVFKAKGTALLGAIATAERAPGGLPAVRALMSPEDAEAIEPLYAAHVFYDLDLLIALMTATAELLGTTLPQLAERGAVATARTDIEGRYRLALRASSPLEMAKRLPRAFNRYFSPSAAEIVDLSDDSFSVRVAPVPEEHEAFFKAMNQGFVRGALQTVGATTVSVEWMPPTSVGRHLALTFVARWVS